MEQYLESKKGKYTLLGLCTVLGILFTFLFYGQFLGMNYGIFVAALLMSFLWLMKRCSLPMGMDVTAGMVLTFLLALGFTIHANLYLNSLNFILIPLLLLWISLHPLLKKMEWDAFILQVVAPLGKIHGYLQEIGKLFLWKKLSVKGKGILIGSVLSIVLLFWLVPLMVSADEIFGYFIGEMVSYLAKIQILEYLFQIILAVAVASYLFAYVGHLQVLKNREEGTVDKEIKAPVKKAEDRSLAVMAMSTVLVMLNVLYLIFSVVQFRYLFLGNTANIPNFSYAQYARSGFFQMMALTVFNVGIILLFKWLLKEFSGEIRLFSKAKMTLLVLFNNVFIASSFYRMHLYESTFGYTLLRLGVYLILILESVLMLLVLWGIWNEKVPIIKWGIVLTLFFYAGVNMMNIDGFIARKNVDRYFEKGVIDMDYFHHLSYDAYPQMERLLKSDNVFVRQKVVRYFQNSILKEEYSWREYSMARAKAQEIVKNANLK